MLLEVQRALLPAGREREWVARHAAEFCAWMNPRFSIVPHDGDVSAEELLALVPARFRAR